MSGARAVLVHEPFMEGYSFGEDHPMGPRRVSLAFGLARQLGILEGVEVVSPREDTRALVELAHEPAYIDALADGHPHPRRGIGTADNPLVPGLHRVAQRILAASVEAARQVWEGPPRWAANIAGGLHHAHAGHAHGFCLYNDAVAAIRWLLAHGARRVAYVDLDVHHGDGVEAAFWDDPRVLTVSIHETGLHLFPGTGAPRNIGGPEARGTAANVAVQPGVGDDVWVDAVRSVVPALLGAFGPDVLVTQHGADPHRSDPLADLRLSMEALAWAQREASAWADAYAGGRWIALGGGGYQRDAVGRAWAHLLATLAGAPVDSRTPTPPGWGDLADGRGAPSMGDGVPFDPDPRLDHARRKGASSLFATTRAVFPQWGLEPLG